MSEYRSEEEYLTRFEWKSPSNSDYVQFFNMKRLICAERMNVELNRRIFCVESFLHRCEISKKFVRLLNFQFCNIEYKKNVQMKYITKNYKLLYPLLYIEWIKIVKILENIVIWSSISRNIFEWNATDSRWRRRSNIFYNYLIKEIVSTRPKIGLSIFIEVSFPLEVSSNEYVPPRKPRHPLITN